MINVVKVPWMSVKRWDGSDEAEGVKEWPQIPLEEALSTEWSTDAMIVSYTVEGEPLIPLLKAKAMPKVKGLQWHILVYDVDPPKGVKPDTFKPKTLDVIEELAFDHGVGWWETMRGYRVIVWLDTPATYKDYTALWWGYHGWLAERGLRVDENAKDSTRLMRLPNVYRKDSKTERTLKGAWELPTEQLPWVFGEPPPATSYKHEVGGLRPLAAKKLAAGDRNTGLFRIACSMRRLGLTEPEMEAALTLIDQRICDPPLEQTDPGELTQIVYEKVQVYDLGEIGRVVQDRPGTDMELDLGSESEVGDWVLRRLETGLGVRSVFAEDMLRLYDEDKGYWVTVDPDRVSRLIMDLDGCWCGRGKARKRVRVSSSMVKGAWGLIKAKRGAPSWPASPPGLLVQKAGKTVRIGLDGEEKPQASFYDTWAVPCPVGVEVGHGVKWLSFLDWFTCKDPEIVGILQEWIGGVLFGMSTAYQKALLLWGPGNNGKSVLLKVLKGLLPPDVQCSIDPRKLEEEYWRARLAGKALNVVTEMQPGGRGGDGAAMFKAIISGDSVDARQPGGQVFEVEPIAGHILSVNTLPNVADYSRGFWRRWLPVPCEADLGDVEVVRDYEKVLLAEEGAFIVEWAAEGARRLAARGEYGTSARVTSLKARWIAEADQVVEFLKQWDERVFGLKEAYAAYCAWVIIEGAGRLKRRTFKQRLEQIVGPQRRGPDRKRVYEVVV